MSPSFILPGMGMSPFWLGHVLPLRFFKQEFYFVLCLVAGAGATVQVGSATGADALAFNFADRLEGDEQVYLFDQDLLQVDLVVFIENIFQLFFLEGSAALVDHFLREKDDVEVGMDLEFERLQAADADQGYGGLDLALSLDALVLFFEKDLVFDTFEEIAVVFEQLGIVDVDGIVQGVAFFGNLVDVYYHW
jgi:hypothetical protein